VLDSSRRDAILRDSPWALFFKLSMPGIMGMLVISLNNFIDALFVGQLVGPNALAGVSLAFPLTLLTAAFTSLISVGSSSLLSRALGEGDSDKPGFIAANVLWLSLFFSVVLTVFGYLLADELMHLVGGRGEQAEYGAAYYRVFVLATIFRMPALCGNMLIRAEGRLREAMIYVSIVMVLNMALDPLFIHTFGWGVEGAAWANNASMFVYLLLNGSYYWRGKTSYPLNRRHLGFHPKLIPQIISVGISASMMQFMFLIQNAVVFNTVRAHGNDQDIAIMAACYRILMLAVVPVFGFIQAFQPVVGINYGAGRYRRVIQATGVFFLAGTLFELAIWLPMEIWPRPFLAMLLPDFPFEPEHFQHFRIIIATLPTLPFLFLSVSMFQFMGKGIISGFLIGGRQVLFFVPVVWGFGRLFGLGGVYWAHPAVDALALLLSVLAMSVEFKRLRRLADESESSPESAPGAVQPSDPFGDSLQPARVGSAPPPAEPGSERPR